MAHLLCMACKKFVYGIAGMVSVQSQNPPVIRQDKHLFVMTDKELEERRMFVVDAAVCCHS